MATKTKSKFDFKINRISSVKKLEISDNIRTICLADMFRDDERTAAAEGHTNNCNTTECFHTAIAPVLFISQFFAIMPVRGVLSRHAKQVEFKIFSVQVLGTFLFLVCALLLTYLYCLRWISIGINAKNAVGIIFYSCGICACLIFLRLAIKWPQLIRYWSKTESVFLRFPYEQPKLKLSTRIRLTSLIILLLSLLEHGTYLMSVSYSTVKHSQICNKTISFEKFMVENYYHVFSRLSYNVGLSIVVLVLNGVFTLIWNYLDLFIALISFGIAIRFEQLNVRIVKLTKQKPSEDVWSEIRLHFAQICDLIYVVDEHLSPIVLLSTLNNLYFICYQLLNIFNKLRWAINYLYFWYSMLFLIGRTVFVLLVAATINDRSKETLKELRKISTINWCIELDRLTNQMSGQCVALTGMKFFSLTRSLIFGMAGTIVTYELVLLQFDESSRRQGLRPLCA